jgi:LacI family transcriptional regulator
MSERRVTMQDIADRLGISKVTVSKALNDKPGVSEELKKKIIDLAVEMNYKINSAAKALKTNRTGNIGVIVPEIFFTKNELFYTRIYHNIEKQASKRKINTIITILTAEDEANNEIPLMCKEQKVDGILVLGQVSHKYINYLQNLNFPTVLVDFYYRDINLDHVVTDNFYASYNVTSYLIESGHKKIGFLGNTKLYTSIQDRYLGYCKALLEHGLELNDKYVIKERNDYGVYIDIELPENLPTAFVCNCDKAAYLLGNKLISLGYKVPDDVSIVGFDDVEFSTMFIPNITTVRVRREEMAEKAVKQLLSRIDNNDNLGQRIVIGADIIHRDSVKAIG